MGSVVGGAACRGVGARALAFARDYGKDSPKEDFATTFGFYFMDFSGTDYSAFSGDVDHGETKSRLGDKYEFMADWIRTL